MSDNDQDRKLDLEPGEEEFDELEGAPEEEEEFEAESHEAEQEQHRLGRGRHDEGAHGGRHASGSVRESHERVHIDDRLSAAYALIAAIVLLGALAVALAGNWVPEPSAPTLPPLIVPTAQVAPSASPVASSTVVPTVVPTAVPTIAPTIAPSAS